MNVIKMNLSTSVNGQFQKIVMKGNGCKILDVQCSLGKLEDSPSAPWKSPEKYPFALELSGSLRF